MKIRFVIASFAFCSAALGQVRSADDSLAAISIATTPVGADVYVDSTFVGKSPLRDVPVTVGRHILRAYYPSVFSWNPLVVVDSMEVSRGVNPEKQVPLGTLLRVQTDPPGSTVILGGAIAGTTPLYLQFPELLRDNILISKPGYDTLVVTISDRNGGYINARLSPRAGFLRGTASVIAPGPPATNHWITYASGATMIGSGVLSAYLKDRANREFDRYMSTKDPGSLSSTRRLDKGAAIALAVSQVSFAVLAYILLSE